jgi:hypothetical protein
MNIARFWRYKGPETKVEMLQAVYKATFTSASSYSLKMSTILDNNNNDLAASPATSNVHAKIAKHARINLGWDIDTYL